MSITKNRQTPETLQALARAAFPDKHMHAATELTEGMFNAAYRCEFADGTASILKIAPADQRGLLSNEVNLMQAEVAAMRLLQDHGVTCIPKVQHSDFSRALCCSDCFFMEVVPGCSLSSCNDNLPEQTVNDIMREVGLLQRRTAGIHSDKFGLLGDPRRFGTLYELTGYMLGNVLDDAARANISFGFSPDELHSRLERDRACFDQVQKPSLVHMDMWEGNIFVHEGRLSGVIDWERALWGDPLMDDRFRSYNQPPAFLAAFGVTSFTPAEKRRIHWYDMYLHLTMLTESHYRQYENIDWAPWLRRCLEDTWKALELPVGNV